MDTGILPILSGELDSGKLVSISNLWIKCCQTQRQKLKLQLRSYRVRWGWMLPSSWTQAACRTDAAAPTRTPGPSTRSTRWRKPPNHPPRVLNGKRTSSWFRTAGRRRAVCLERKRSATLVFQARQILGSGASSPLNGIRHRYTTAVSLLPVCIAGNLIINGWTAE